MINNNVNNSQIFTNESKSVNNAIPAENKNTVNENKSEEAQSTSNLSKPDSAGITNYNGSKLEPKIVSFESNSVDESDDLKPMNVAKNISDKDLTKILEFVNQVKNDTTAAVLKSFDLMLQHARKLMEENQKYIKNTVIPKEEAIKAQALREGKQPPTLMH